MSQVPELSFEESVNHSPADLYNDSSIGIGLREEKHIELTASQATCGIVTRAGSHLPDSADMRSAHEIYSVRVAQR
ncbi:hypothetical protein EAX62_16410 [Tessaracoccus antarcticus]|uniref:Uncharacterized protein n=1 Tax=Tessaracoccus antarcticus TaxID=2479848 RepID=A0A3M0G5L7_9ACTN|nr:hypothetical protein EAX62_16410 [Tessaracoccus antarcticus]